MSLPILMVNMTHDVLSIFSPPFWLWMRNAVQGIVERSLVYKIHEVLFLHNVACFEKWWSTFCVLSWTLIIIDSLNAPTNRLQTHRVVYAGTWTNTNHNINRNHKNLAEQEKNYVKKLRNLKLFFQKKNDQHEELYKAIVERKNSEDPVFS